VGKKTNERYSTRSRMSDSEGAGRVDEKVRCGGVCETFPRKGTGGFASLSKGKGGRKDAFRFR